MIKEALLALNERSGFSPYAIAKYMEEKHKDVLPLNYKNILGLIEELYCERKAYQNQGVVYTVSGLAVACSGVLLFFPSALDSCCL